MIAANQHFDVSNPSVADPFTASASLRLADHTTNESQSGSSPVQTLTVAEAAGRLGVCRSTIRRMLREQQLRGIKYGDEWFVRDEKLQKKQAIHGIYSTMSAEQAAQRLHRSTSNVYAKLRSGQMQALKFKGTWHVATKAIHVAEISL